MKPAALLLGFIGLLAAQPTTCTTSAQANLVRHEGLTERIGDLLFVCTGLPGQTIPVSIGVRLNTEITNRVGPGNVALGTVVTIDNGSSVNVYPLQAVYSETNLLLFEDIGLIFPNSGIVTVRLSNILANASGVPQGQQITAQLSGTLSISQSQFIVGISEQSLYVGYSGKIICAQNGSPLPSTLGFAEMLNAGTVFTSTRLTEGLAGSFSPKTAYTDNGTRFLIQYTGFPQGARLFVPNVVAGSDASTPTAGGDLGGSPSGGQYTPTVNGSLLLSLVQGADVNGAGGTPMYTPGAPGSGEASFDAVTELTFNQGIAYAVYEVMDWSPTLLEFAQFPTFLGLAPNTVQNAVQTSESVTYAAVSTVTSATATDPVPRFLALTPPADCGVLGDCGATYFPQLSIQTASLQFPPYLGGSLNQTEYLPVTNAGAGLMYWTASVSYMNGAGWLSINPTSGLNNRNIAVTVTTTGLPVGAYQANLVVDAGEAGRQAIPVTLTITTVQAPGPNVTAVENAASFALSPVVSGSLATLMGTGLAGQSVGVTFNGLAANILYASPTQINLMVPVGLGAPNPAQMVVTVDGQLFTENVPVAPFAPGIFSGALLNQDGTVNSSANPAAAGSIVYFWATGLSGPGMITVRIGAVELGNLYYAGPAPGYPGVQQVNVALPPGVSGTTTQISVCGTSAGNETCSPSIPLVVN
jgi:uncharacterized protein (TIGR03437 family)